MKKKISCLLLSLLLIGCSDENNIPQKNSNGMILNQATIEKLKKSLLEQIQNNEVIEVHLFKKRMTTESKDIHLNVEFTLNDGTKELDSLPVSYQNGEWTIQCDLPICSIATSPVSVTQAFITAIENQNSEQLLSTLYVPDPYIKKRLQQQLKTTLPNLNAQFMQQGGVSSIDFSTILINQADNKAIVPFELIYQDGKTDRFKYTAIKRSGKWFIQCDFKSCLIYNKPESVVGELIDAIANADPERFVNVLNATPAKKTKLLEYYKVKLFDLKAKILNKKGVKNIVIDSISPIDEAKNKAKVVATIFYNDGSKEQQSYVTYSTNGRWFVQL